MLLLEHGEEIEARDANNLTLLHYAALTNSTESAQLLLKRGAEIETREVYNLTRLH